ncbi:PREDICTED: uncharacterized protein LOC107188617 [Dufourea novaeangliae]|nr:PREDICTED: uncharacterized protein LOC107188617 [Dufourea novaeangliae]
MTVNMDNPYYLLNCLNIDSKVLSHRILLLEEMGARNISLEHISRFPTFMLKTIKSFKRYHNIPHDECIAKNIFKSIGLTYDANFETKESSTCMSQLYLLCLAYYKTVYLNIEVTQFLWKKYRSFRVLHKLANIFKKDLRLSKDFLNRNSFLLNLDLDQVTNFINKFKSVQICGVDSYDVIRKCPRLLRWDANNTIDLLDICNKYGISDEIIHQHIDVLRLKKHDFINRYSTLANHPEFSVWIKHPMLPYVMLIIKCAMERVEILRSMNRLGNISFHTLYTTRRTFFRSYAHGRHPQVAKRRCFQFIFKEHLGEDYLHLSNYITRHPHWRNIPFSHVAKMLKYLKSIYSVEDISQNIQIILYPQDVIKKMLTTINDRCAANKENDFTPSQRLALCVYMLEKMYHFTGDAVWKIMYSDENENTMLNAPENRDDVNFEDFDECLNGV